MNPNACRTRSAPARSSSACPIQNAVAPGEPSCCPRVRFVYVRNRTTGPAWVVRSGMARDCRGCRHGPVRAVRPRLDPGGGHRGVVEEMGGLTAVRCSCGAVLSGAMVLDRHQTRAAERRSHPASACGTLRSPTRAGVPLASRGTGQLEQPDRGTHQSFLGAHVIAEPRIILLDEGDQIVRTRPRPEATDNPPHKCASWVKKPCVPHGFWNVRFRIAERNRRRFGPYGRV
jgi:hypothetical protein